MPIHLDLQQSELLKEAPDTKTIVTLIDNLLDYLKIEQIFSCTIRLVDSADSAEFNQKYRNKQGPTNVLSFPYELLPGVESDLLGDLLICAPLVVSEARAQHKTVAMHLSHLVVHGTLHLLGYDHITNKEAQEMESIEIQVLENNGIANPYEAIDQI